MSRIVHIRGVQRRYIVGWASSGLLGVLFGERVGEVSFSFFPNETSEIRTISIGYRYSGDIWMLDLKQIKDMCAERRIPFRVWWVWYNPGILMFEGINEERLCERVLRLDPGDRNRILDYGEVYP